MSRDIEEVVAWHVRRATASRAQEERSRRTTGRPTYTLLRAALSARAAARRRALDTASKEARES